MRILHILPSIRSGGVANVVYNLTSYQIKQGEDVTIFVSSSQHKFRTKEKDFVDLGANVIYSHLSRNYDPRHVKEFASVIRGFDIVHVHLFPNQLWVSMAYRSLPESERPVLLTTEHNTFNNRRRFPVLRHLDRYLYTPYSRIVSISESTKENLDRWLSSPAIAERDIVIQNGVDIETFRQARPVDFDDLNLPSDARLVIMVARLTPPKDPLTLVKAIKECPDNIHAVFIGYGPQESEIRKLSEKLLIEKRIHLLGLRNDVPSCLKRCDLGVLSTNWDGFGLVAVEYMAAGLPVLASDVDGLRDVIGNKDCLFPVGDYRTLAQKITGLLTDNEAYSAMKAYCHSRADVFSVGKMNREYLHLYKHLIDGNKENN